MNVVDYRDKKLRLFLKRIIKTKDEIDSIDTTNAYHSSFTYLLAVMDILMKFDIIVNDITYFDDFLDILMELYTNRKNYHDFIYQTNRLLVMTVSKSMNLSLESLADKEKILDRIYDRYIVHGYCFYAAPLEDLAMIKEKGLLIENKIHDIATIDKIISIFRKYRLDNPFLEDAYQLNKDYLLLTDSPAIAYLNALEEPRYLSDFYLNSMYFLDKEDDRHLLYMNNLNRMKEKIDNLCNIKEFTPGEKDIVMQFVNDQFANLNYSDELVVVCVKRSALGRDSLREYKVIREHLVSEDFIYACGKILDSRFTSDKRYTKILPFEFEVILLPSYRMLFTEKPLPKTIQKEESPVKKTATSKKKNISANNQHGYADVIALSGLLLISVGFTLSLFFEFFGIR